MTGLRSTRIVRWLVCLFRGHDWWRHESVPRGSWWGCDRCGKVTDDR